jgi:hypothetical protein
MAFSETLSRAHIFLLQEWGGDCHCLPIENQEDSECPKHQLCRA